MANPNKASGTRWETVVADYLNESGLAAKRTGSADHDKGDIWARAWTFEAKAEKTIDLPGYLRQLAAAVDRRDNAEHYQSAVMVKNRRHSTGDGYAVMSIESYRALMVYVSSLEILLQDTVEAVLEVAGRG